MSKLTSFTFITLNGFYNNQNNETDWHSHSGDAAKYANDASGTDSILLFGRKTYEMMAGFWPTSIAADLFPVVAENMNKSDKIVCSNTLKKTDWENTTIMKGGIIDQLIQLKQISAKDITILGSGSILRQLSDAGLIDQYTIMIDPVAIGKGHTIFENIENNLNLKLINCRFFKKDSIIVLKYEKS